LSGAGVVLGVAVVGAGSGGSETGGAGLVGAGVDGVAVGVPDGVGVAGGRLGVAVPVEGTGVTVPDGDTVAVRGALGVPPVGEDPRPSGAVPREECGEWPLGVSCRVIPLRSATVDATLPRPVGQIAAAAITAAAQAASVSV
jgi:hypothetical protein